MRPSNAFVHLETKAAKLNGASQMKTPLAPARLFIENVTKNTEDTANTIMKNRIERQPFTATAESSVRGLYLTIMSPP